MTYAEATVSMLTALRSYASVLQRCENDPYSPDYNRAKELLVEAAQWAAIAAALKD